MRILRENVEKMVEIIRNNQGRNPLTIELERDLLYTDIKETTLEVLLPTITSLINKRIKEQKDEISIPTKGFFIALEGIDGSGKTTQIKIIDEYYTENNIPHYITKEPSIGEFGKILREKLKDRTTDPIIDALLFALDRIDHCNREIKPHLEKGEIVITDRYLLSNLAYQNVQLKQIYGYDFIDWIMALNRFCIIPNLVIFIDITPKESVYRTTNTRKNEDIEKFENFDFQSKLHEEYKNLIVNFIFLTQHLERIDGNRQPMDVCHQIIESIKRVMKCSNQNTVI